LRHIAPGCIRFLFLLLTMLALALGDLSASVETGKAVPACARGRAAVVVDGKHLCRVTADLRVSAVGLPKETRVGGSVNYAVAVSNIGRRTATGVVVSLRGGAASLLSLSSAGGSCARTGDEGELAASCSITSLVPHAKVTIELAARATVLGRIVLHAKARSKTHEVEVRNNVALATTSVVAPDSVHVAASRILAGHPYIELRLEAISGPHGEEPVGNFVLDWEGHSSGHVTCLRVSGHTASVGVEIDEPDAPLPPGAIRTDNLLFLLTDGGSPGVGRDTITFGGSHDPVSCLRPFVPGPGYQITGGEITISDTP
jgi:Domain of unknown function DUF11